MELPSTLPGTTYLTEVLKRPEGKTLEFKVDPSPSRPHGLMAKRGPA
jgi:hypothetical protein